MRDEYLSMSEAKKDPSERAHCDFPMNLAYARSFCESVQSKLKEGMRVSDCGSHGLPNSLLTISWKPPIHAKKGNYADSIFLHQARAHVVQQIESVFNRFIRMITHWEGRQNAVGF